MGFTEIVFILLIYLLLFGAKGMPSLARNLGKAMKEVRRATGDIQREIMDGANDIKRDIEGDHRSQPKTQTAPKSDETPAPKPDQPQETPEPAKENDKKQDDSE